VVQQPSSTRTFTQEVRAVSSAAQPFRWTVGAYYRTGREADTAIGDAYVPLLGSVVNVTDYRLVSDYSSYAVFGQAEYDILSNLTLIGGLRWFEESGTGAASFGGSPYNSLKRSTTGVTPRVGLRYTVSKDLMAYATYSEGYRPGGFNQFAGPTQYQPDKTKNYEIGAKYASPDGRFTVDGSVYYIDWSNMQFTQLSSGGLFTYVGNANKASSRGAELQASYRWSNGFSLALSGSVTDAHLDSDVVGNYTGVIRSGTTLPAVPPYKVSAVANYQRSIFGDYILDLTADISLVGHQNTKLEEGGVYHDPIFGGNYTIGTKLKAYQTGNLRAEVRHDKWSVAVYLKNVWNETAPIADDNFLPTFGQPLYYLQPRTVGVELSAKF
jgi:iron complex outermembrane recepter protein